MKRLAMLAASGAMALLPSIASARPHYFFGFDWAAAPFVPALFAPEVTVAPPVVEVTPPVVCAAPAVTVAAPPAVYAPAPGFYYSYGYPAYRPYYHYVYAHPAWGHYRVVRYHR